MLHIQEMHGVVYSEWRDMRKPENQSVCENDRARRWTKAVVSATDDVGANPPCLLPPRSTCCVNWLDSLLPGLYLLRRL